MKPLRKNPEAQPVTRRAALFLLLYLAVLLYLSLYPWQFVPNPGPRTLIWDPLVTRRAILDAALNVAFYIPVGAAAFLSLRRGMSAFIAALALGTLVSFTVEWIQLSIPTRFGNLTDLFCNCLGTLLGAVAAFVAIGRPLVERLRVLYSPRALLVGLWVAWQAFTFFLPRSQSTVDISREIVGLVVLALLAASRRIHALRPRLSISVVLLVWLSAEELRPFQFQGPPQQFWWIPFQSWFVGAAESYYGTIFEKLFLYTAILWLEGWSGIGWIWALIAPGAILAAGEFAQRYLPGRTPELTDLALLAAGAVLLKLLEPLES